MDDDDDIYGLMAEENQYRDVEEAIEVPAPGTGGGDSDTENKRIVTPKVKRSVKPRLKLDADRLTGPRGLPVIESTFKNIKFKGKGHELQDLSDVLARLQHWAHRLYPKLTFEDCIARIEELGSKKPVVRAMEKLRMGDDDVVENIDDDVPVAVDPFDTLVPQAQPTTTLTDEQRARMLRNRLIAEERRMAKMKEKIELAEKQNGNNKPQDDFTVDITSKTIEISSIPDKIDIGTNEYEENMEVSNIEKSDIPDKPITNLIEDNLRVEITSESMEISGSIEIQEHNEKSDIHEKDTEILNDSESHIPSRVEEVKTVQNLTQNSGIDVSIDKNDEISDSAQENSQNCTKSQEKLVQNFDCKKDLIDESILSAFEENDFSLPEDFPF